jgi:hypothetical protein
MPLLIILSRFGDMVGHRFDKVPTPARPPAYSCPHGAASSTLHLHWARFRRIDCRMGDAPRRRMREPRRAGGVAGFRTSVPAGYTPGTRSQPDAAGRVFMASSMASLGGRRSDASREIPASLRRLASRRRIAGMAKEVPAVLRAEFGAVAIRCTF